MTVLVYPTHNHILSAHTVTTIAEKQVSHTNPEYADNYIYINYKLNKPIRKQSQAFFFFLQKPTYSVSSTDSTLEGMLIFS